MGSPFRPAPVPVEVSYDCRGTRASKLFTGPKAEYQARAFYTAKSKAGKNPKVRTAPPVDPQEPPAAPPQTPAEAPAPKPPAKAAAPAIAKPKAVAAYVRVSTVGQNEAGQRAEIEKYAHGHGLQVQWFVDKASGNNLDRPAFKALQQAIFNGEVGTVVVWKLDRLSRSLRDGITTLCDWCDRGLRIIAVTQQIDFNGTLGKMLASVLLGVAEMEQETRRERQAAGIEQAKKRGVYKGRRPGSTKAKPARAAKLRAKGLTMGEIATALGVSRMTVHRYLKSEPDS